MSARDALARGDLQAAGMAAQAMIRARPQDGEGYFLMAMTAAEAGQVGKALPMLERALACDRDNAEYLAQNARLLILLRRDGEAAEAARRALEQGSDDARTLDTVGCVLARLGDHETSVRPFEGAVAREPDNLDYRYNLAAACGFTGRVDAARGHYEAILAADPGNARSHYGLAILSRQMPEANHVARLEVATSRARDPQDLVRLRYALAKELEDIGEADRAFATLSTANADYKRQIRYDFAQDAAIFDAIEAAFSRVDPGARTGIPDASSIFVVGMPRTGTTLVDRILSSHAEVASTGELQAMPLAVKQAAGTRSRQVIDPETAQAAMAADPAKIGQLYLVRAAHHRPAGATRYVDKLPANFLHVGHIIRSLPNARIVCLRRNPMDTVWSNFRNLFATQSAYYAYSYDLLDTARYYARFDRLMAFWDRLYPGRVLQFGYEALVHDQEVETRRLLEHCGLSWDPACLAFHENRAAVATPSAAQVRRSLNAEGIGRWKTHAEGMAEVRSFFEAQGIPID
ncbi:tetratricopeptide repeat-containing sulfotransferase family protein [Novosphingobium mangrovi (ex Huang et al. 2023)]|uniref:Sulfotransferase n=1 Tax=Novosphingobium mangrovi (ex Huang et al. 2023) TaxID=2976432 RepID=A0ABT2I1P4_9SPHN|nr:tetratricopeptide repeat-containing sulfotransferase family protein [Novosphingobium mangrovi (ex Huang et al. 2023)]MCT2398732.1 sulfotransferase [Novosphingobium mangrovi (ex Huang et al. 2023)]